MPFNLARDEPETPAAKVIAPCGIRILYHCLRHKNIIRAPSGKPPDIRTFVVDLARLAGFHPSKRQPLPGTQKVWEAWRKFRILTEFAGALKS